MTQFTSKYVKSRLSYNPITGLLHWKYNPNGSSQWNGRWADKEAFTTQLKNGYKFGRIDYKGYYAHRIIWFIQTGHWPNQIDHINGIRNDNAFINIRACNISENNMNSAIQSNNTSGYVGVSFDKRSQKWEAHIGIPDTGKKKSLGLFTEKIDAIVARKNAEKIFNYHKNHGRPS